MKPAIKNDLDGRLDLLIRESGECDTLVFFRMWIRYLDKLIIKYSE